MVSTGDSKHTMILVLRTRFRFIFIDFYQCLKPKSHLLLLWAIQGSCWVKNCFLGIVEKFRDVLQVFGRALKKKRGTLECIFEKELSYLHLLYMCPASGPHVHHFNLVTKSTRQVGA